MNIDLENLSFTEIDLKSKYAKRQYISFPRIEEDKKLILKTPFIKLSKYGIQKISEYYPTEQSRAFLKLPLDPAQKNALIIKECLSKLDKHIQDNKKEILGVLHGKANYIPIIKTPEDKMEFIKLKFDLDYNSKNVKSNIFINKKRQKVKTMKDIEKMCPFKSKVKFLLLANKLWIAKSIDHNTKKRNFGLNLVIKYMDIKPARTIEDEFSEYAKGFLDDEEEESEEETAESEEEVAESEATEESLED